MGKVKKLLELYLDIGDSIEDRDRRDHLRWMCEQLIRYQGVGAFESASKFDRWLGFIQGCLWMEGLRTIDEMRADIRNLGA